ncbi:hypothetical protein M514_27884 [Trichuris suis]|uniref:Uncharacterized protein n=1 Tax=Trichuris suis TaxID=68888 RepID=A0A085MRT8_9BILA|nr:hypothetical protein M514_27884 [Trichuris suis]
MLVVGEGFGFNTAMMRARVVGVEYCAVKKFAVRLRTREEVRLVIVPWRMGYGSLEDLSLRVEEDALRPGMIAFVGVGESGGLDLGDVLGESECGGGVLPVEGGLAKLSFSWHLILSVVRLDPYLSFKSVGTGMDQGMKWGDTRALYTGLKSPSRLSPESEGPDRCLDPCRIVSCTSCKDTLNRESGEL